MLTTEEIEHTVNEAYRKNRAASLRLEQPGLGQVVVEIEELSGASLSQSTYITEESRLQFRLYRPEATLLMFFQLRGNGRFSLKHDVWVPERHHSLCYLPILLSKFVVGENQSMQSLAIKFDPKVAAAQLLEEGMEDDDWQRMLEDGDQPFSTIRQSRPMGAQLAEIVRQLVNCPYKGKFAQTYKDSLVRLLLIEQLLIFRENRVHLNGADTKLTRRDIEALHDLKQYLEQHFLEDLSLEKIARHFGLNTFKLKYGFKKLFDTSVMRYIDDQKMQYARRLLLDSQQDVLEVADQLGYNHYSNFSVAFKRRFGCSPVQVKEQALVLN
ncbi:helix-turn-helix transcriptional regulator [Larkinella sp. VNQ87]|uniref:AraC family transcriptional regulator n=1 Tax=Larkinella sp. VNQ87 TaxID=3400921 RepID=UPI003BFAA35E